MRKKQEIIEALRKASGSLTSAGLNILTTEDSVLSPQIEANALAELLKASEIVTKVMVDIKLNMKEEE